MSRRNVGLGLMVGGGLIALVGLIGMLTAGGGTGDTTAGGTATTQSDVGMTTTSTAKEATTTAPTPESTTTSTPATTTTTLDPGLAVEAFVPMFADAIQRGDTDYLMSTLDPGVIETFGEELCRTFIETEILMLVDYRLTGDVTGPTSGSFSENMYSAPVAFSFQGQAFEADATFAVDRGVTWFTECRAG